jgi:protein TonB
VDAVGHILEQREQDRFPWGVGVLLAVLLHLSIAASFLAAALGRPARYVPTRAVAVRLLPAGTLRGGAEVSVPETPREKPKIVKVEESPPPPSEKAKLLPAKEEKKKRSAPAPAATRPKRNEEPAPPAAEANSREGEGGPVGAGGNEGLGGARFDQPGFDYPYYVRQMVGTIFTNWWKPTRDVPTYAVVVHFRIARDGTISEAEVVRSSGLSFFDRAALRAILDSSPLPPLPSEFVGSDVGVSVSFTP